VALWWSRAGWITLGRERIQILDAAALRAVAERRRTRPTPIASARQSH
jgi:hypothetical protein